MSAQHKPPQLRLERRLWAAGCRYVAGVDEAGRGAWAGPVVAAAVILPADRKDLRRQLAGVLDSKLLSSSQRAKLAVLIRDTALAVGVGGAGPMEIDRDGILPATRAAMQRAIAALRPRPRHLLVDAVDLRALVALPQQRMNHGEHASLSIAAASIIAKVARDEMMKMLDTHYPAYGFAKHKGYGTRAHQLALRAHGAAVVHRHSFRPLAALAAPATA